MAHRASASSSFDPRRRGDPRSAGAQLSQAQKIVMNLSSPKANSSVATKPKDTMQIFKLQKIIGEGTYGVVFKAADPRTASRSVAVKEMHIDQDQQGLPSVALREISFLAELRHPHIIPMLDILICEKSLMVVFEYLDMDLREFLERYPVIPFSLVRNFTFQLFQGLAYIHARRLIHRDMKPQNILVNEQQRLLKIGDFGLGRMITTPLCERTNEVVTLWYRCPELLLGADIYDASADVWSLAIILIEILENKPIFEPDCEIVALHLIFQTFGTPTESDWDEFALQKHYSDSFPKWEAKLWSEVVPHAPSIFVDLLKKMLMYPPQSRISCVDALQHELFTSAHGDPLEFPPPDWHNNQPVNFLSPKHMTFRDFQVKTEGPLPSTPPAAMISETPPAPFRSCSF